MAFAREVRDPGRHPFSTPSGKIELYSRRSPRSRTPTGSAPIPPIPTWIPPAQADSRWPLELVSPKSRARTHSTHDNQAILRAPTGRTCGSIPTMPPRRGIVDGAPVRVFNDRGSTVLPARVTDRIARGVVSIKEGAWFTPGRGRHGTRAAARTC